MRFFRIIKFNNIFRPFTSAIQLCLLFYGILAIYSCDTTDSVTPYQDQVFIKLYGGNGSEEGKDLVALPDGGFVAVGSTTSQSSGGKDVYVVRTDNLGNVVWENRFGKAEDDIGNAVILGNDGNLYVSGESVQENSVINKLRDVYVLGISLDNGTLLNEKLFGDSLRDEFGTSILSTVNDGFLITSTWNNTDTSEFFMIETDGSLIPLDKSIRYVSGNKGVNNLSTKSFNNIGNISNPFLCFGSVYETLSKSFYFQVFEFRSIGNQTPDAELYGNESSNDYCTDVFPTSDGGFVLAGKSITGSVSNEIVVKINPTKEELWRKVYSNPYDKNVKESGIIQTNDGGYLVSSTLELDDPLNDEISLLKLDFEGEVQWRKTFGSNNNDVGAKVIQLDDGSYVLVGTIGFEVNPNSQSKLCLIKINKNGDLVPLD